MNHTLINLTYNVNQHVNQNFKNNFTTLIIVSTIALTLIMLITLTMAITMKNVTNEYDRKVSATIVGIMIIVTIGSLMLYSSRVFEKSMRDDIITASSRDSTKEYMEFNKNKLEFVYKNNKINISNEVLVEITTKEYTYYVRGIIFDKRSNTIVTKHDNYKVILTDKMLKEIKEYIIEKINETDKSSKKDIENYIKEYITYIVFTNYNKRFTDSRAIKLKIENIEINFEIESI